MLIPRLRCSATARPSSVSALDNAFANLFLGQRPCSVTRPQISVRNATHAAQGRANKAKDGPGKRLGAKKSGEQYVIPGNIIFRQRGTHWYPGENCSMGRDHTIHATQAGYVKYYRDPERHPKRQYIGVVFERHEMLPHPPNAARRRRLGMLASRMRDAEDEVETTTVGDLVTEQELVEGQEIVEGQDGEEVEVQLQQPSTIGEAPRESRGQMVLTNAKKELLKAVPTLRPGYQYRQANWEIGQAAERAGIKHEVFKPGDRFAAWRKRTAKKERAAERRTLRKR